MDEQAGFWQIQLDLADLTKKRRPDISKALRLENWCIGPARLIFERVGMQVVQWFWLGTVVSNGYCQNLLRMRSHPTNSQYQSGGSHDQQCAWAARIQVQESRFCIANVCCILHPQLVTGLKPQNCWGSPPSAGSARGGDQRSQVSWTNLQ